MVNVLYKTIGHNSEMESSVFVWLTNMTISYKFFVKSISGEDVVKGGQMSDDEQVMMVRCYQPAKTCQHLLSFGFPLIHVSALGLLLFSSS